MLAKPVCVSKRDPNDLAEDVFESISLKDNISVLALNKWQATTWINSLTHHEKAEVLSVVNHHIMAILLQ